MGLGLDVFLGARGGEDLGAGGGEVLGVGGGEDLGVGSDMGCDFDVGSIRKTDTTFFVFFGSFKSQKRQKRQNRAERTKDIWSFLCPVGFLE